MKCLNDFEKFEKIENLILKIKEIRTILFSSLIFKDIQTIQESMEASPEYKKLMEEK